MVRTYGLPFTFVLQNYLLERLIARISVSKYRKNFVVKGGFLISSIVGLDTRTTMDLDTTIKGISLTKAELEVIFREICSITMEDDIHFIFDRTEDIREEDEYPGVRVFLFGEYAPIKAPVTVDVTTGDKITPREIEYSFRCLFDETEIHVLAYNLETIIAEKIETILSRGTTNTRPRDYYDVFVLYQLRGNDIDQRILTQALCRTAERRKTEWFFQEKGKLLKEIRESDVLKMRWENYRRKYAYAKNIEYADIMDTLNTILQNM